MTKEKILEIYLDMRRELGRQPTYREFYKYSGLNAKEVIKTYHTFGKLTKAAGDKPRCFRSLLYSEDKFFTVYGEFIREHRRKPTTTEWMYMDMRPRSVSYVKRFGVGWPEMPNVFLDYAKGKPEWYDVCSLIRERGMANTESKEVLRRRDRQKALRSRVVPGVLYDLVELSSGESSPAEFEEKCGMALEMLGFEVTRYGQGLGRQPDGVAKDPGNRYAVIYDAKSRRDSYSAGTDDRAFGEYIRGHKRALMAEGYDVISFMVISSGFAAGIERSARRMQSETGIPVCFITAETLLRLVAKRIEKPKTLDCLKLKEVFVTSGIVSEKVKS